MESAKKHSGYQAGIRRMTHESPTPLFDRFTNEGFAAQAVAENVAMMSSFTIEGVMRLWIGSPGHFANIIGNYSFFGSGVAKGSDNRYYWTQHFARPFQGRTEACLDGPTNPSPPPIIATNTSPKPVVTTVTITVTFRPSHDSTNNDRDSNANNGSVIWHWPWKNKSLDR